MEREREGGSGDRGGLAGSPLLRLVKQAREETRIPDLRNEIVERMVSRLEENRSRRRERRAFAAGAASALLAGLLAKLTLVGLPWLAR